MNPVRVILHRNLIRPMRVGNMSTTITITIISEKRIFRRPTIPVTVIIHYLDALIDPSVDEMDVNGLLRKIIGGQRTTARVADVLWQERQRKQSKS